MSHYGTQYKLGHALIHSESEMRVEVVIYSSDARCHPSDQLFPSFTSSSAPACYNIPIFITKHPMVDNPTTVALSVLISFETRVLLGVLFPCGGWMDRPGTIGHLCGYYKEHVFHFGLIKPFSHSAQWLVEGRALIEGYYDVLKYKYCSRYFVKKIRTLSGIFLNKCIFNV